MNLLDSLIYLCLGILAIPLLVVGLVIIVTGIVRFFLALFKISPVWGVICLFFPLAIPFVIFMHWKKLNGPVFNVLGGIGLLLLAGALFGGL
jgi:hypothetical protein